MEKPSSVEINVESWKCWKMTARMKKCVSMRPIEPAKYWAASVM
jgi:hypothetical protein